MRFREIQEAPVGYTVGKGDTLWALAKKHGVSVDDIAKASGIADPNKLQIGQKLVIPGVAPQAPAIPARRPDTPTSVAAVPSAATTSAAAPKAPVQGLNIPTGPNPVAVAQAKAAQAGAQAAALQQQAAAGQKALDTKIFKQADQKSMDALAAQQVPTAATTTAPTAPIATEPSDQDKALADRLAQADSDELSQMQSMDQYIKNPGAGGGDNTGFDDGLDSASLAKWGKEKQAVDPEVDPPQDVGTKAGLEAWLKNFGS